MQRRGFLAAILAVFTGHLGTEASACEGNQWIHMHWTYEMGGVSKLYVNGALVEGWPR